MIFLKREKRKPPTLSMTALIDVFSILVIFLLLQFNAGNLSEATAKNVLLPSSAVGKPLAELPSMYLSRDLSGQFVFKGDEVATTSAQFLNHLRFWVKEHEGDLQSAGLNLFVDEKVQMKSIRTVMKVLRRASINKVYFSVKNASLD